MQVKTDRTSSHTPWPSIPSFSGLLYGTTFLYTPTHAGITVEDVTTNLPPVGNRTDEYGYCSSCPFKNMSLVTLQPCVYTVEVTRVFKGNYTVSIILTVELYSGNLPCYQCHRPFATPEIQHSHFIFLNSTQEIWNPFPNQHPGC